MKKLFIAFVFLFCFLKSSLGQSQWTTTDQGIYSLGKVGVRTSVLSENFNVYGSSKFDGSLYTTGRVGVGTSALSENFNVYGSSKFDGSLYTTGRVGVGTSVLSENFNVYGNSKFDGNIYTTGKVGIGTTTPDAKLDVRGTIKAHEIKVCLEQGCDFVFQPDYNLMPISELKSFVSENRHLPEVAPAAVMESEGINLSEMNAVLLQKIEELTLYMISQYEKTKALEKEIEYLKSKE